MALQFHLWKLIILAAAIAFNSFASAKPSASADSVAKPAPPAIVAQAKPAQPAIKPAICTRIYLPVCAQKPGAAPRTYSNKCVAMGDGAKILHDGTCKN